MSKNYIKNIEKLVSGILIETRNIKNVDYLIENFYRVFNKSTKLYYFHGKSIPDQVLNSIIKDYPSVVLVRLHLDDMTGQEYSNLVKTKEFWNNFDTKYVLTIQTDGCLCLNSKFDITQFFHYHYIGGCAPKRRRTSWWKETAKYININKHPYLSLNGGFSLRNVESCIKVLEQFPPERSEIPFAEDIYFSIGMLLLGLKIGIDDFARNFCSHVNYRVGTFCVHKTNRYPTLNKQKQTYEFLLYCPEFRYFFQPIPR